MLLHDFELNLIGTIPEFETPDCEKISELLENYYARLNLPGINFE